MIKTVFTRPWEIKIPALTRYMDEQYVSEFFENGKLRLSSFKAFRKHADEQRGDFREGSVAAQIVSPNGNVSLVGYNGQEAYILCAGTVESPNMEASFSTKSGFRIMNHLRFADAISRHVPGFIAGMEGLCCYREDITVKKSALRVPTPDQFPNPEDLERAFDTFSGEQSRDSFFVKHISYAHQGEYRFIWFASGVETDHIDIVCPEAAAVCQRI